MNEINHTLPDDVEELKKIILIKNDEHLTEIERAAFELNEFKQRYDNLDNEYKELDNKHGGLEHKYSELETNYENLNHKFQYLQKLFFGKKSEKLTPEDELQGLLFNEAEAFINVSDVASENETEDVCKNSDVTVIKQHTRSKAGRKPIPADIPRKEIIHDLSDEEKKCACCSKIRPSIGTEETEELEYIPAKIFALKHIYPKYGPCDCDDFFNEEKPEVISAPAVKRMLPGSIASEGLLAYVFISKFCDALPFYRLSKMFRRIDVDISRATMCNWHMNTYETMKLFFEMLKETLKSGNFIRMDETTLQVLHEKDRKPESKSYMWVAIGYPARGRPLVLYEYHPTREGIVPMEFLEGFKGYLQTDGYAAYISPAAKYELVHVGCFAHARREFHKAYNPKNNNSSSYKALMIIQKIYKIESDLREKNLTDDVFVKKRRAAVMPVLDELHAFLVLTKAAVTPSSLIGQAVDYTLKQWDKLIRYLDLACMTPDNNEIERSIKSFVIGRKNWMFSNTPRGAHASAGMYSLIESVKANGLDPYLYLRFLFAKFPYVCGDREELRKLLPCFVSPEDIKLAD
jgi:transposase